MSNRIKSRVIDKLNSDVFENSLNLHLPSLVQNIPIRSFDQKRFAKAKAYKNHSKISHSAVRSHNYANRNEEKSVHVKESEYLRLLKTVSSSLRDVHFNSS